MGDKFNSGGGNQQPPPYSVNSQPRLAQPDVQGLVTIQNNNLPLGSQSQHMTCPHCRAQISTRVVAEANSKTHIVAAVLCAAGWICCACFFPYHMDSCLGKKHYCPSCNSYLGEYNN